MRTVRRDRSARDVMLWEKSTRCADREETDSGEDCGEESKIRGEPKSAEGGRPR